MRKLVASFRSGLNALRDTLFKSLFRARFRYDVFISYSHSDARDYAAGLKEQLRALDFTCFIDEEESPPGVSLDPTLEKALGRSAVLVLLATPRALTRPYVVTEFEKFASTKRRIIPINISEALTRNGEEALKSMPWSVIKERKLVWVDEADGAFAKRMPSPPVADGIDKLFKYTRRNARVRAEIIGASLIVLLAATGAGFVIKGKNSELATQANLLEVAKTETEKQQGLAAAAGVEAKRQLDLAEKATDEAQRQGDIAEKARQEALRQQEIARAATAEAEKQQAVARDAKAEANRQQQIAREQMERNRHMLYVSDLTLAQRAHEAGDGARVYELLNADLPRTPKPRGAAEREDLRSFYWYYLWHHSFKGLGTFNPPSSPVISALFSPDGKPVLATAGADHAVELWDAVTRRRLALLKGHTDEVSAIVLSPDGKTLASAGGDHTVRLWDFGGWKELAAFTEQPDEDGFSFNAKSALAFSPDGRLLASATGGLSVKVWDIAARRELATLKAHSGKVYAVSFSPDGKLLASGGADGTVKLWDTGAWKELTTLAKRGACENEVCVSTSTVAFSPDGKLLATATGGRAVKLWDTGTWHELAAFGPKDFTADSSGSVHSLAFSPDSKTLASLSWAETKLWDAVAKKELVTLKEDEWPAFAAFDPNGKTFFVAGKTSAKLWDVSSRSEPSAYEGHDDVVYSVAFSPDGKTAASGSFDLTVKLWDADTGHESAALKSQPDPRTSDPGFKPPPVLSLAFSPDGKTLAGGGMDYTVRVWDIAARREVANLTGHKQSVYSVAFSPDGRVLASASLDHTVKLWDARTWKESATLKGHSEGVYSVAFSPDGETLASGCADGSVKLWDARTGRELATLKGHAGEVRSVAFSPDGRLLASASKDQTVRLWDTRARRELATLKGHTGALAAVVFSPDGRTLASGGSDKTVRLWDTDTRSELATLRAHTGAIFALAFSPDGRRLASASLDNTVRLWVGAAEGEVAAARSER
ncbi:MAG TPA: TIR domain-containing protein [Pyrinomonadaceae bacterium]|jgi:WD40 repeat protein|nr:TIR domain-containing protein [Pyrinomonadaceae bacterium]